MDEYHVLAGRCPKCQTVVKVRTRSREKLVACPSCGVAVKITVAAVAAPNAPVRPSPSPAATSAPPAEQLPTARLWSDEPTRRGSAVPAYIAVACVAGLVLGAGAAFALRPPADQPIANAPAKEREADAPPSPSPTQEQPATSPPEVPIVANPVQPPAQAIDPSLLQPTPQPTPPTATGGSDAQARVNRAMARVQSLERQRRDWLLANSGRMSAAGKAVVWPNERLLQQALQELEMARREAGLNR